MKSCLRLALLITLAVPSVASAHIQLVKPTPRVPDQSGQKTEHCGSPGYVRAANPTKTTYYKPGETIRVMWNETIGHKGWYRIAFLPNGEAFHFPPPSNGPDFNNAAANYPTLDMTGMTDPATGTVILKDRIADPDGIQGVNMADVTLPNVECNNCTLQVTQFMLGSGATSYNLNSVYFFCADLALTNTPPTPTPDAGPIDGPAPDAGGNPADGGDVEGGCSTGGAGSAGGLAALGLFGLIALRRRSRRA